MSRPVRFWASALLAAATVAALAVLVPLYPPLGLVTPAARQRAWLLAVFTAGVTAILFGAAAWLGGWRSMGFRDVASAGSFGAAAREKERAGRDGGGFRFDRWTVATGVLLVAIYFAGWLLLERR